MEYDELYNALSHSHFDDFEKIRRYVKWVKFRRLVHNVFYFQAHWIQSNFHAHWIGK